MLSCTPDTTDWAEGGNEAKKHLIPLREVENVLINSVQNNLFPHLLQIEQNCCKINLGMRPGNKANTHLIPLIGLRPGNEANTHPIPLIGLRPGNEANTHPIPLIGLRPGNETNTHPIPLIRKSVDLHILQACRLQLWSR